MVGPGVRTVPAKFDQKANSTVEMALSRKIPDPYIAKVPVTVDLNTGRVVQGLFI